jgi:hypothetical protein
MPAGERRSVTLVTKMRPAAKLRCAMPWRGLIGEGAVDNALERQRISGWLPLI